MKANKIIFPGALIATMTFASWSNIDASNTNTDNSVSDSIPSDTIASDTIPDDTIPNIDVIPVTSISITPKSITIFQQESATFTATTAPEDATNAELKWSVVEQNTSKLIQLTPSGKSVVVSVPLTVAPDTYKIVASNTEESVSDTCELVVLERAKRITLSRQDITIVPGETVVNIQAFLTYYDGRRTSEGITKVIEQEDIAIISGPEEVTGVAPGWTRLVASGGGLSVFATIHVCPPVDSMYVTPGELTIGYGETHQMDVTILPEASFSLPVTWSIDPPKAPNVSIDKKGKFSTTHNPSGSDTPQVVYVVAHAGLSEARCKVNIIVPVTAISLSPTQATVEAGQACDITATLSPEGAYDTLVWESSDPSVATVSETGTDLEGFAKINAKVEALKAGQTIISAKTGNLSSICLVTVTANQAGVHELQIDTDAPCDVFDLNGKAVLIGTTLSNINSTLAPGIYVIKAGGKAHKVVIGK